MSEEQAEYRPRAGYSEVVVPYSAEDTTSILVALRQPGYTLGPCSGEARERMRARRKVRRFVDGEGVL